MPKPSPEHAPIMQELAAEMKQRLPRASIFAWHMLDEGRAGFIPYVSEMYTKDGDRIDGGMPSSPENRILLKHHKALGWDEREEGLRFAFSIDDAQEAMDLYGSGTLDPQYEGHPGTEGW